MQRKTSTDHQGIKRTWVIPETPGEITDEMMAVVIYAVEWQDDEPRIDYDDLWDRIESSSLPDGTYIGLPSATDDPIYAHLRRIARKHRADLT